MAPDTARRGAETGALGRQGRRIKERRGNLSKLCNPERPPLAGMEMNDSLGINRLGPLKEEGE